MPDSRDSNGWRPIKTIPSDRTVVLWAGKYVVGSYDPDFGEWRDHSGFLIVPEPTHWLPLPAPPTEG